MHRQALECWMQPALLCGSRGDSLELEAAQAWAAAAALVAALLRHLAALRRLAAWLPPLQLRLQRPEGPRLHRAAWPAQPATQTPHPYETKQRISNWLVMVTTEATYRLGCMRDQGTEGRLSSTI